MKQKIILMISSLLIWSSIHAQKDTLKKDSIRVISDDIQIETATSMSSVNRAIVGSSIPAIIPPSPHSSELGRFGAVPVGLYTGTVQFSLSIFELKNENLQLPVSLNYSSSGFMVDKLASWTGYDWSLNAGGIITRYRKGKTDLPGARPYSDWYTLTTAEKLNMLDMLETYEKDLQPDWFVVSLPNYSFKFVFNNSGNPITIPYTPVKIITNSTGTYSYFHITTPDGIIYKFNDVDVTYPSNEPSFCTAWHLSEILHPTGDKITFTYDKQNAALQKIAIDRKVMLNVQTLGGDPAGTCNCSEFKTDITEIANSISYLSQINFPGVGKIIFQKSSGRIDAPYEFKLDRIIIKNSFDNQIKSFQLNYQFPLSGPGYSCQITNTPEFNYRMFLNSVNEQDANNSTVLTHSFEYNNVNELPSRFSYAKDHWGFFNGKYNNDILPLNSVPSNYQGLFSGHVGSVVDRSADYLYSQKGILKKIQYPTGGYSTFEYEANKNSSNTQIGGCRLLRTKSYVSSTESSNIKKYNYLQVASSVGLNPSYYQEYTTYFDYIFGESRNTGDCIIGTLSTNSLYHLYVEGQNQFCYPLVEIMHGENGENGRELYSYHMVYDSPGTPVSGGQIYPVPMSNTGWSSGNLEQVLISDNTSNKKKENTNYVFNETRKMEEIPCLVSNKRLNPIYLPLNDYERLSYYDVVPYKLYSNWYYIGSSAVTSYESNGTISYTTNNLYENAIHCQKTQESMINSNGVEQKTKWRYPNDYGQVSNFNTLINKNIIALPIDVRTYNGTRLISGEQTKYNDFGQPTDLYNFESSATDIAFSTTNPFTFTHKQTIAYDAYKKPIKVNPDNDIYTHYIWAYNRQYPVAKIVTPLSTTISVNINDVSLSKSDSIPFIKNDVTYLKGLLSSSYLNNANYQVTIYTYKPLVGITSQTDPTGITTFYQYDKFGRLEFIKDNDEKLLKKNVYHYAGQ